MPRLRIKQVRSGIGRQFTQKRTVKALGIRHMHQVVEHEDTATIRGMINKVSHLLEVETVED